MSVPSQAPALHILKLYSKFNETGARLSALLFELSDYLPAPLLPRLKAASQLLFTLIDYSASNRTQEQEYVYLAHFSRSDFFKGRLLSPLRKAFFVIARLCEIVAEHLLPPALKDHYRKLRTLAVIYLGFYSLANLLTGVREVTLMRIQEGQISNLKIIGLLYLAYFAAVALKAALRSASDVEKPREPQVEAPRQAGATKRQWKCVICMEEPETPSATACGHVFCWECVTRYVCERGECPSCRGECEAGSVVVLRN